MKHQIWLLALVVLMGLACRKDEAGGQQNAAAAPKATPYTLKVTFEGLVGYLNQNGLVWALLPKASADTLPAGVDPNDLMDYPEHHAFLKVDGVNVKDFGKSIDLLIPIDGKEIQVSDDFGTGSGIPQDQFMQNPSDPRDKLDLTALTSKAYPQLAARIRLPLIDKNDWSIDTREDPNKPPPDFVNVDPERSGSYCAAKFKTVKDPRVQAVTWKKMMTGEVTLRFQSTGGIPLPPLVLVPDNGNDIQISIVNKEWLALYDPKYVGHHWPAYRWFYNLSDPGVKSECTQHYYPQGGAGGNRCPQKLYIE